MARTISPSDQSLSGPPCVRLGGTSTPGPKPPFGPPRKFVVPPSSGRASALLWQPVQPVILRPATVSCSGVARMVMLAAGWPCGVYSRYTPSSPTIETAAKTSVSSAVSSPPTIRSAVLRTRQARVESHANSTASTSTIATPINPLTTRSVALLVHS